MNAKRWAPMLAVLLFASGLCRAGVQGRPVAGKPAGRRARRGLLASGKWIMTSTGLVIKLWEWETGR